MSDWLTGALTGGGSSGKASRTYGDAVRYAQGLSQPYTKVGQNMYRPSMQAQNQILKSDWLAPTQGAYNAQQEATAGSLAREGMGGSGIAAATEQANANQYQDMLAKEGINVKQGKLAGYSSLAQQAASNALNWAEFVNNMRMAQAGGAQTRSNQLTSFYDPLISSIGGSVGQGGKGIGAVVTAFK